MFLAAGNPAAMSGVFDAAVWMGVLLVVVGVGAGVLMWVRRKLLRDADQRDAMLSLDDLGRLRSTGEVSESEYAAIRKAMIAGMIPPSQPVQGRSDDKGVQRSGGS